MADGLNLQVFNYKPNLKKVLIGGVALLVVIVIVAVYFALTAEKTEVTEEEIIPEETVPEQMKSGEVGEIEEGKTLEEVNPEAVTRPVRPPETPMPPTVFDTKGEIFSIEKDSITVKGSGENFADQRSRTLTVKFTAQTLTFEKGQKVKYVGLDGLNHLKPGEKILINSSENIRGKTEFIASYINKI